MAANNIDFNAVLTYLQTDGSTPLYLTTTGISGDPPLSLALWLRPSPDGDVAAEFSNATLTSGLTVLPTPNDNQLYWSVPFATMATLDPGLYYGDIIALISSTSRLGYGSFLFPVEQGVTL